MHFWISWCNFRYIFVMIRAARSMNENVPYWMHLFLKLVFTVFTFSLGLLMSKWIYCYSRTITRHSWGFLENGMGNKSKNPCYAYSVFWKSSGKLLHIRIIDIFDNKKILHHDFISRTVSHIHILLQIRCHQYWPEDNIPVTVFGDIVITKLVEDTQIDWTIRDLKIERVRLCLIFFKVPVQNCENCHQSTAKRSDFILKLIWLSRIFSILLYVH